MPADSFDITYAAHTASCTFLLDAEGVCRRIVMAQHAKRKESQTAARCVGAQYVASLDASAAGCLVEMPRVGAAMLFARVDERGRVSLVRTGPCTGFEQAPAENPFESVSVKTSAPELTPRTLPPSTQPSQAQLGHAQDPDYFDADDRTVRIQALRDDDLVTLADDGPEIATAEWAIPPASAPRAPRSARSSAVRAGPSSSQVRETVTPRSLAAQPSPDAVPTLRNPRRDGLDEDDSPFAAQIHTAKTARGMLPQPPARRDSTRQRAVEALGSFTRRRR